MPFKRLIVVVGLSLAFMAVLLNSLPTTLAAPQAAHLFVVPLLVSVEPLAGPSR